MQGSSDSNSSGQGSGGNNNRRRRHRGNKPAGTGPGPQAQAQPQNRSPGDSQRKQPRAQSSGGGQSRSRRAGPGRTLTANQVLVKYDNLLEQHLVTRRKYFEYFNRSDERQLYRLEKNFFDSIEHLRRFEKSLEPWQREALEARKTERYRLDSTYSENRELDPYAIPVVEVKTEDIEDPHFKDTQKEAYREYQDDTEESSGSFEDYLKLKGLN